jgi:hypothetical protein
MAVPQWPTKRSGTRKALRVQVDACLELIAHPRRKFFAEELALGHAGAAAVAKVQHGVALLGTLVEHEGVLGRPVNRHEDACEQQRQQADGDVQPHWQHIVFAPPGAVLTRQLTRHEHQQRQRAPQGPFGGEIGAAKLLQELPELGRQDVGLLPTVATKARARLAQQAEAVQAIGGRCR